MTEAQIRHDLRAYLTRPGALVLDERGAGCCRTDLLLVGQTLHAFEIKSARDSLRRLPAQAAEFSRIFDQVTLVAAPRHSRALDLIPPWWGVLYVSAPPCAALTPLREGRQNPAVEPRALATLLWHDETMALLEARGLARGVRGKPRAAAWDRLCQHFTLEEIREAVCERLRTRSAKEGKLG